MTLYFVGEAIELEGDCDDGWVWGHWRDHKDKPRSAWFWAMQLTVAPL